MAEQKHFVLYRGDDQALRFTMTTNGSVAGWTTVFTVRKTTQMADPPILSVAGTIVDAGSGSVPGIFDVSLSQAQLLLLEERRYVYSFKRTNTGAAAVLTEGVMTTKSDIKNEL